MSSFKPMVKMYTDEPAVSLKLKKGGKVKAKKHHKEHEHHGHHAMKHHAAGGMHQAFESEAGMAPKKPSMSARRKAMNPQLYAKGGKVAHKGMGGIMNQLGIGKKDFPPKMAKAPIMPKAPMIPKPPIMYRDPHQTYAKGGKVAHEEHEIQSLKKELKHHEHEKASKAHHGLKHGGKVHHISGHPDDSHEHHKHMAKHHAKMHKESGSAHHKKKAEHHKAMCKGGSYASGGEVDRDMTKTTIEGNAKRFVNNIHDGEHADHTSGKTGIVKLGNAGGFKHGGHAHKKYAKGGRATGSSIPSETNESETRGHNEMGGTIEGNEHYYEDTDMHSARPFSGSKKTGGVSMSNAGGFKHGGKAKMHHKADGGTIDKVSTRNTIKGGDWENRPADTTPKGKTGTTTGEVKLANAGGFKHGGHAAKKHYATGGNVVDDGKPTKYPHHFISQPVANTMQSGTFKKGGKVKRYSDGDLVDASKGAYDKSIGPSQDDMDMAKSIRGFPRKMLEGAKSMMGIGSSTSKPAGSVTKTEKSVTVAPAKKRGGRC